MNCPLHFSRVRTSSLLGGEILSGYDNFCDTANLTSTALYTPFGLFPTGFDEVLIYDNEWGMLTLFAHAWNALSLF